MNAPSPSIYELRRAYGGRRVLVTGHTGFKGSWLTLWLHSLGAEVTGYALAPDPLPCLFVAARVEGSCHHVIGDIRDLAQLRAVVRDARPDYLFHLAAQPLVRLSYEQPLETVQTNVLGTTHVLEALRLERNPCAAVIVTSDKCYENRERDAGYREDEAMGGHDVYSMSKGAAELVVASYRRSFFQPADLAKHGIAIATARAGNVIGGGDWARDRLVPDCIAALSTGKQIAVRSPASVRPWQHVLEPLSGYLLLGAKLSTGSAEQRSAYCEGWNFGPRLEDARPVADVVRCMLRHWGAGDWEHRRELDSPHEAGVLRLNIEKAASRLSWRPRWGFEDAVKHTVRWYRAHHGGAAPSDLRQLCLDQIQAYCDAGERTAC